MNPSSILGCGRRMFDSDFCRIIFMNVAWDPRHKITPYIGVS